MTGLASGVDWSTVVDELTQLQRASETRMQTEETTLQTRSTAFTSLKTQLTALSTAVNALKDGSIFNSRTASVSDSTVSSATAAANAPLGTYVFNITQRATTAALKGKTGASAGLSTADDVSGVVLGSAGFSTAVTAGTFTVNGKSVTIATTDTLQQAFDKISTATNGAVTAAYSSATDKISLSSAGTVVLGSATDTSNFLQVAKLTNNGTGAVTSTSSLGGIKLSATLGTANFGTAISDGGSGAGEFKINGVAIAFSTTADSVQNVIDRINNSSAGVTANYDTINNRFVLTNKTTGDMGIAIEDVTGNFAAAAKLDSGTLSRGQNALYTINNGGQLSSQSNTIGASSSGITGLTVNVLKEGAATVQVGSDTGTIKTAITNLITQYNSAQNLISTQTAYTTDSQGKVTAGIFSDEGEVSNLASQLRGELYSSVSGLSGTITRLDQLGYATNSKDDTVTLGDSTQLDNALANNLGNVKAMFSDATNGIATKLAAYLTATTGDKGMIATQQTTISTQIADLNTQIAAQERLVQSYHDQLISEFTAMETAEANTNSQLTYLTKNFA